MVPMRGTIPLLLGFNSATEGSLRNGRETLWSCTKLVHGKENLLQPRQHKRLLMVSDQWSILLSSIFSWCWIQVNSEKKIREKGKTSNLSADFSLPPVYKSRRMWIKLTNPVNYSSTVTPTHFFRAHGTLATSATLQQAELPWCAEGLTIPTHRHPTR